MPSRRTLSWIAWSLLLAVQGARGAGQEPGGCPHPPVPAGASYVNVTGGLGEGRWGVRYVCDTGNNIAHLSSRNSTSWKFLS